MSVDLLSREETIRNAVDIALTATQSGSAHTNPLHLSTVEEALTGGATHGGRTFSTNSHSAEVDEMYTHPLLHKNKAFYSAYVWLHALISYFMLLATSSIVTIYYNVAGLHTTDDHGDDHSSGGEEFHHYNYQLEKAKVTGGLAAMWTFMLFMEVLQPRYRRMLRTPLPENWAAFLRVFRVDKNKSIPKNKRNFEILYSKLIFVLKLVVIGLHLLFYFFSPADSAKGNYFVGGTAIIASLPSLVDIAKLSIEFVSRLPVTISNFSKRDSLNMRDSLTAAQIESAREGIRDSNNNKSSRKTLSIDAPFSQRLSGLNEALILSSSSSSSSQQQED